MGATLALFITACSLIPNRSIPELFRVPPAGDLEDGGGGDKKGNPAVGVSSARGGGARGNPIGDGGAGHCLPFDADAPANSDIVGVWSKDPLVG